MCFKRHEGNNRIVKVREGRSKSLFIRNLTALFSGVATQVHRAATLIDLLGGGRKFLASNIYIAATLYFFKSFILVLSFFQG